MSADRREVVMTIALQRLRTPETKLLGSSAFRAGLASLSRWFADRWHRHGSGSSLDCINDHYLRDMGLESGEKCDLSESTVRSLHIGPRAS